jgi:hypothetical protein
MKPNKSIQIPALGAVLFGALALWACRNPFDAPSPGAPEGGKGRVVVRIVPNTARTLLPEEPDFDHYGLVFTQAGGEITAQATTDEDNEGKTVDLPAGTWNLAVTGYDGDDKVLAWGSADTITLQAGQTETVNITLSPIAPDGEGRGTFSWEITLDGGLGPVLAGAAINTATLTITPGGDPPDDLSGGLAEPEDSVTGELGLTSGYYQVVLEIILDDGRRAGYQTSAHIYQGLETKFQHTVNAEDFAIMVKIGGTVTVNDPPDEVTAVTVELIDGDDIAAASDISGAYAYAAQSEGVWTWAGAVPVNITGIYFKVSAVIDGVTYAVLGKTGAVDVGAVPAAGQDSIALGLSFMAAPAVTGVTTGAAGAVTVSWTQDSAPGAVTYDLYCLAGTDKTAGQVLAGTKITNATSPRTISGLAAGGVYCVLVRAGKPGYVSADSAVAGGTAGKNSFTGSTQLTVKSIAAVAIGISITAPDPAPDTYKIYLKVGAGEETLAATVSYTASPQSVSVGGSFTQGASYTLRVVAVKDNYNDGDSGGVPVKWARDDIDLSVSNPNPASDPSGAWTYGGDIYTIKDGAVVKVSGDNDGAKRLTVAENARAVITLDGVTIDGLSDYTQTPLVLLNGADLTLALTGDNTLIGMDGAAIYAPEGRTLTIEGPGRLSATTNGTYTSAIGGAFSINTTFTRHCGTITINGGSITAVGGRNGGPGIGGAKDQGRADNITINGGAVIAINNGDDFVWGRDGPGIGGWASASVAIKGDALVFAQGTGGWVDVNGLTQTGGVLVGKNKNVNVFYPDTITLYQDTTVPADFTFTIPDGKTQNLNGFTLTNTGTVENNGTINKQGGAISNQGGVTGTGTIITN